MIVARTWMPGKVRPSSPNLPDPATRRPLHPTTQKALGTRTRAALLAVALVFIPTPSRCAACRGAGIHSNALTKWSTFLLGRVPAGPSLESVHLTNVAGHSRGRNRRSVHQPRATHRVGHLIGTRERSFCKETCSLWETCLPGMAR